MNFKKLLKKHYPYLIIILVVFYLLRTFFYPGVPQTHDFNNHLARLANFYMTVRDGHFPPRWAPNLNYHFGYPVFNYMYYLTYIPAVPLFVLGFSLETSLKIVLFAIYIFGGIFFYKFLEVYLESQRRKLTSRIPALAGTILYLSAPQQLSQIFVRGNVGASTGWLILPFCLWAFQNLILSQSKKQKSKSAFLISSLSIFLLILSHNSIFFFGFALILGYIIFSGKNIKLPILSLLLGLGLGSYFLLPAILETDLITIKNVELSQQFSEHFLTLNQLFYSSWDYGFSEKLGTPDTMSFQLGLVLWIVLIIGLIYFLLKKKKKFVLNPVFYFILVLVLSVFFQIKQSWFIWKLFPFLLPLQFPWRILILTTVSASILSAIILDKIKNQALSISLVIISLILAFQFSTPQGYLNQDDYMYLEFPFTSSVNQEQMPIGFDMYKNAEYKEKLADINNIAEFEVKIWKTHKHEYQISSPEKTTIIEHIAYFPGWQTFVDGQKVNIKSDNPDFPGINTFNIEKGTHQVATKFSDITLPRKIGDTITLISFVIFLTILSKPYFCKKKQ